jgi:hypothetical protein
VSAAPSGAGRLRFGTFLAPNIMPVYEAVADEVARRLQVETELIIETDYEACTRDENEVCFVCSLPYVEFERRGIAPAVPIAAPVLEGARYGGRPVYFSDVIVHRDSPFMSFLDLRDHSWAYNEPLSHSGYGITRYHLLQLGETHGFFSEVVEAGYHETAIRLVAAREVDAPRLCRTAGSSCMVVMIRRSSARSRGETRFDTATGWIVDGPSEATTRSDSASDGSARMATASTCESMADLEACEAAGFMEVR